MGGEEELDARDWSEGDVITEGDKAKIHLAIERFWARRGLLGKDVGLEGSGSLGGSEGYLEWVAQPSVEPRRDGE